MMTTGLLVLAPPAVTPALPLVILMAFVVTASNTASAFNLTMANDLCENPRDAARITSLVVFGGNSCGLLAPIVTGYVVGATGGFEWAFRIAAILLVIGAMISATLAKGRIAAEHPAVLTGAKTVAA